MFEKIRSNAQLAHFLLYFASYGIYGVLLAVSGPVVPFMAAKYGLPETDFIFMFWCKALGFVIGGFLTKLLQRFLTFHEMLFYSSLFIATCFMLFPFIFSIPFQGALILLGATACSVFEIILLMCYMEAFKGN